MSESKTNIQHLMSDILCIGLGNQYQGPFVDFFKSVIAEFYAVQFFHYRLHQL